MVYEDDIVASEACEKPNNNNATTIYIIAYIYR